MKSYKQIIDEEVNLFKDWYDTSHTEGVFKCNEHDLENLKNNLKERFREILDEITSGVGL